MRIGMRGIIALALAIALCALPLAAQAELLTACLGEAYEAGQQIEAVLTLGLDEGQKWQLPWLTPEQTLSALQKVCRDTKLILRWARGEDAMPRAELELSMQDAVLLTGMAAFRAHDMTVQTSILPGKELLLRYDDLQAGGYDIPAMLQMAEAFAAAATSLQPGDAALEIRFYRDDQGALVGLDGGVEDPSGREQAGFARYDRLTQGTRHMQALQGELAWGDGGQVSVQGSYTYAELLPGMPPKDEFILHITGQPGSVGEAFQILLNDSRSTGGRDKTQNAKHSITMRIQTPDTVPVTDGSIWSLDTQALDLSVDTNTTTRRSSGGAFTSAGSAVVGIMGAPLASVTLALSSKEHVPAQPSGNQIVEIAKLSETELKTLQQEALDGLTAVLMSAEPLMPQELSPLIPSILSEMELSEPAPLGEADFAVELAGGSFNMVTCDRAELERITGQRFERFDEFPNLGISYDRLLTDTVNFFADVDGQWVNQMDFKEGGVTARGIGLGSTQAEVSEAYAEPQMYYEEHGYIRFEDEFRAGDGRYRLCMVIDVSKDKVTDLFMSGSR